MSADPADIQALVAKLTPEEIQGLKRMFDSVSEQQNLKKKNKRLRKKKTHQASARTETPPGDKPRKPQRKRSRSHKGRKSVGEVAATRQNIDIETPRENLFLKMREMTAHKSDVSVDKKLASDRTPTPRVRQGGTIELECVECGYIFDVSPSLAFRDKDTKELRFTCNDCQVSKRSH